ncbi:MAG TPA: hypothetical protein VJ694_04090 [Patescibacteria group bacterium]|nr:hypothetical protein [Patescibacteria group bacterium]
MNAQNDAEAALGEMEAELKKLREASRALASRSRAFTAAVGKRRDESLIAKLRRQLGLG